MRHGGELMTVETHDSSASDPTDGTEGVANGRAPRSGSAGESGQPDAPQKQWVSAAPPLRHVRPFDGLRCIGALAVMFGHTGVLQLHGFNAFVDMFMVVSGLLITSMLLQEHRESGSIDLRSFYTRRAVRLVPSVFTVILGFGALVLLLWALGVFSAFSLKEVGAESLPGLTYTYNWFYPDFNGQWHATLWTVALEEQFYLVIGVVLLVCVRRGWVNAMAMAMAVVVVVIQVSRFFFASGPVPEGFALGIWMQRPDALMVGVIIAVISANIPTISSATRRRLAWVTGLAAAALLLTIISATQLTEMHAPWLFSQWMPEDHDLSQRSGQLFWTNWGYTVSIWSIGLIAFVGFRFVDWKPAGSLSSAPMVWVGARLSYIIYVVHFPIQRLLRYLFKPDQSHTLIALPPWLLFVLQVTLPVLLAIPIYKYVESWALKRKARSSVLAAIDR